MNCGHCGASVPDGAQFCAACGKPATLRLTDPVPPEVKARSTAYIAAAVALALPAILIYDVFAFFMGATGDRAVAIPATLFVAGVGSLGALALFVIGWGLRHGAVWTVRYLPAPVRAKPHVKAWVWGDETCPGCDAVQRPDAAFCPECGHGWNPPDEPFGEAVGFAFRRLWQFQPIEPPRTQAYSQREPHETTDKVLLAAIGVMVLGWYLTNSVEALLFIWLTVAVLVPPVLLMIWLRGQDRYEPEPWALVLLAFGWGALCGFFAQYANSFVGFAPVAGLTEEIPKALIVLVIGTHHVWRKEVNGPVDGLIYGAVAGLGFEAMENFQYVLSLGTQWGDFVSAFILRSGIPFSHMMWTGLTGSYMGLMMLRHGRIRPRDLFVGVVPAVVLHAANNSIGYLPLPGVAGWGLFVLITLVSAYFFFKVLADGLRDEGAWGFGRGEAPVEEDTDRVVPG